MFCFLCHLAEWHQGLAPVPARSAESGWQPGAAAEAVSASWRWVQARSYLQTALASTRADGAPTSPSPTQLGTTRVQKARHQAESNKQVGLRVGSDRMRKPSSSCGTFQNSVVSGELHVPEGEQRNTDFVFVFLYLPPPHSSAASSSSFYVQGPASFTDSSCDLGDVQEPALAPAFPSETGNPSPRSQAVLTAMERGSEGHCLGPLAEAQKRIKEGDLLSKRAFREGGVLPCLLKHFNITHLVCRQLLRPLNPGSVTSKMTMLLPLRKGLSLQSLAFPPCTMLG